MKRRQWNSTLPASAKPMQRGGKIARTPMRKHARSAAETARTHGPAEFREWMKPKKRTASEFARIYGSRARVRWIKDMPCLACVALSPFFAQPGASQNAHTVTGGTGRKADAETIVPLCDSHHRRYDQHKAPFDREDARQAMKDAAARIASQWAAVERSA